MAKTMLSKIAQKLIEYSSNVTFSPSWLPLSSTVRYPMKSKWNCVSHRLDKSILKKDTNRLIVPNSIDLCSKHYQCKYGKE